MICVLAASGCSTSSNAAPQEADGGRALIGTYRLVGDVDGTEVNDDATVTITLGQDGTLTIEADQPGQHVTDTGTWSVDGDRIEMVFDELDLGGEGAYELDGSTLRLPFLVFGDGEGHSEWTRVGPPPDDGGGSGGSDEDAGGTEAGAGPMAWEDRWQLEGPDAVAGAVGMRAYAEARERGADREAAVREALEAVLAMENVSEAQISDNGLNIDITLADGTTDVVLTEQLLPIDGSDGSETPMGLRGASFAAPRTTAALPDRSTCAVLPAAPHLPREPSREGIDPAGGYGVLDYLPLVGPRPVRSEDSPPTEERRALLVSPQYDITHVMGDSYETIRGQSGSNIECVEESLRSRGYEITTILGRDGDADSTGFRATAELTDALAQPHGILYFLGHGATSKGKNYLNMGPLDVTDPEVAALIGGRPIDATTASEINRHLTESLGFSYDPDEMILNISPDPDDVIHLWLHPDYFAAIQRRGASFENSLVWLNACSTAATGTFQKALRAKAFVGWKRDMAGAYVADAAEAAFDSLTDGARTLRGAVQAWQNHSLWENDRSGGPAPGNLDPRQLWAGGTTVEYPPMTAQAQVLLFHMRHAPSTATADISRNADGVRACHEEWWSNGERAGLGSSCMYLQLGVPSGEEVDDALIEAGVDGTSGRSPAHGRWTLAD